MIYKIFSVYDVKVESYSAPFFLRHNGEALRSFEQAANDKSMQIGQHPEDFTLFLLGEFNDSNSRFTMLDTPHALGVALEFIRRD